MQKYKRPQKGKGFRSIPLKNPQTVSWGKNGVFRPKVRTGPTEEIFDSDAKWYIIKEGKFIRITGEPEPLPKFTVVEDDPGHMQLRLYHLGDQYVFVQLYYCMGKEFTSVPYRGVDNARRAYRNGNIAWRMSKIIGT